MQERRECNGPTYCFWPFSSLPCDNAVGYGNIHRSHLGKYFMGTLLGMGPQRGMGSADTFGLLNNLSHKFVAHYVKTAFLPYLLHWHLRCNAVYLLWSKLSAERITQLRIVFCPFSVCICVFFDYFCNKPTITPTELHLTVYQ